MKKLITNVKEGLTSLRKDDERGDIAQTVIIIGILVVAAVVALKFITDGIQSQAKKTGNTIKNGG